MKLSSILLAALVSVALYFGIFERDRVLAVLIPEGAEADTQEIADTEAGSNDSDALAGEMVKVVVRRSEARSVDNAVVIRGRTEADRQVELRSETSGQVISDPLRKGASVAKGDVLCELDPGTREAALSEARARVAEAQARLPEAQARLPEARARIGNAEAAVSEAEARLAEALARLDEATINANAASQLSEGGFASETRVANAEAGLQSARAGVRAAEAAVESARTGIVSAEAGVEGAMAGIESVRAGIVGAEAGVAAAERELERLTITAPFDGLLETDTAELGSLLQPGALCATVIQLDPIKLVGFVPETEVNKVEIGAMAGARLVAGEELVGNVRFISRSADPTTRTFRVELEVPNGDLAIRDGQSADILIASEGRLAHLLPQSALTLDDEGLLGLRVIDENNIVQFLPVEMIRDTVDGVWLSGLPDKIAVITVGQEYVKEGVEVDPSFEEQEQ